MYNNISSIIRWYEIKTITFFDLCIQYLQCIQKVTCCDPLSGAADPGGPGGPGPPLKLEIYIVNFLEKDRISFFFLLGPPLEKNRSSAPDYVCVDELLYNEKC